MKFLFIPLFLVLLFPSCDSDETNSTPDVNEQLLPPPDIELIDWIVKLKKESQSFRDNNEPEKALKSLNECISEVWRPLKGEEEHIQMGWAYVN